MQLHLLDRANFNHYSFNVLHDRYPHFLKMWHYHPEFELLHIAKSSGTHFIGDNIERFEGGEVILIGENVPHMWLSDDKYFDSPSENSAEAFGVHFKKDFLGDGFLLAPEVKKIQVLLEKAKRGIKFINPKNEVINGIKELLDLSPFKRMIKFIEILQVLATHKEYKVLSSPSFLDTFFKTENKRLNKLYEYVYNNFKNTISSKDVAEHIGMNTSAFSRYFKHIHRKTFTTYLNEIRVGYACKLLLENEVNITAIGYECGFNNLSNFNRQFKAITKLSPTNYIQFHTQ